MTKIEIIRHHQTNAEDENTAPMYILPSGEFNEKLLWHAQDIFGLSPYIKCI